MTLTAEDLDIVTEKAIECLKNGDQKQGGQLFSALIHMACFAEEGTEEEHIDRMMRLIEARMTSHRMPLEEIRPHVESIMAQMSHPTDRYAGFKLLFRNLT